MGYLLRQSCKPIKERGQEDSCPHFQGCHVSPGMMADLALGLLNFKPFLACTHSPTLVLAGEVVAQQGDSAALEAAGRAEGHVIVNNRPVAPDTPLGDGDYIVLSQEVLKI